MKKYIIRKTPESKLGGTPHGTQYIPTYAQSFNGKYFPYYSPSSEWTQPELDVRNTLGPVPEEEASLEAEGGESAYVPDNGGLPAHYKIEGPRHSEGGVPLALPEDSFIFSDTRSMKLGGDILKFFGKGNTDKKYTPADLAKQYDINKYRKQLQDPDSDPIQVKTAEMMIANYNKKLGQLGLVQESLKSFPDGVPIVALPYLASSGIDPASILPLKGISSPLQPTSPQGDTSASGGAHRHLYDLYGGQYLEGGNSWQNGPQGFGYAYGGSYPNGGGTGYDIPETGVNSPYQIAKEKFWHPQDAHIGFGEWLGNAFDYIPKRFNQELTGYYEDPSTTMQRGHAPNTARDMAGNFLLNPTNWALTKDIATLGAKGSVWAAKNIAKLPGLSKLVGYIGSRPWEFYGDLAKAYGHDAAMATIDLAQKKGAGYIPAITSAAMRKSPEFAAPVLAQDNTQVPVPQFRMNQDIPAVPVTSPDTLKTKGLSQKYGFKGGGGVKLVEQDPDSGATYTTYNDGSIKKELNGSVMWKGESTTQPSKGSVKGSNSSIALPKDTTYHSQWLKDVNKQGYDWNAPQVEDHLYTPKVQSKTKTGVYGTQDWGHGDMYQDWQRRHQWYLQDHPNFDPSNPEDVKDFQQSYNNRLTSMGLPAYFDKNKYGKPFDTDGLFGQHTWATPDPTKTKPVEQVKQEDKQTAKALELNKDAHWKSQGTYAPWWLQDVIGTAGAAGDLLRIKKYLPWAPKLAPVLPDATFVDPTRALAANAEAAAIQTQGANAYGTPQQFSGRASSIQGQHAKAVADTLGQYANENVNIANRNQSERAGILNQTNQFNANTAKGLYDATTIANQQFDNAKNQARASLRAQYVAALTNRAQTQALNEMNPYYHVDPSTGGFIGWTGQTPPGFFGSGTGQNQGYSQMSGESQIEQLKHNHPDWSPEDIRTAASLSERESLDPYREMMYMHRASMPYPRGRYPMNPTMMQQMYQGYNPGYGAMPANPYYGNPYP